MSVSTQPSAVSATSSVLSGNALRSYLPALTGVRAVAAYLVCLHHYNPFSDSHKLLQNIVLEFHIGVPIFFVLSGFLITLRYYGSEQWTGQWWGKYLRNRLARIYPMFFLLTCLVFAATYFREHQFDAALWLLNVSFLRGFFEEYLISGIPQGWTLTVEETFYLLAPVAFALRRRKPGSLWLQPLALLLLGSALVLLGMRLQFHGLFGSFKFMLLYTFFGRCIEFYTGIQLALWYRAGRLRAASVPALYTTTGCLLMGAVLATLVWIRGPYPYGQEHPVGIFLNNAVLPVGIALLFAGLLLEGSWLRWLLSTPVFQVLGKSSYVFYLIHLGPVHNLLERVSFGSSALLFLLLNATAVAMHYGLEQPLNRLLRARPKSITALARAE
jgi:peptidoglycan/LPS O-acetylase OafA/YrhL